MGRRRRTDQEVAGDREAQRAAATLGGGLKRSRVRRRLTQQQVSERIGISRTRYSGLERGEGASAPLSIWFRAGVVLGTPLAASFSRDTEVPLADAGHAAAQELVLRFARSHGRTGSFELPSRASRDGGSVDVGIRDDRCRVLILTEIWNALTDLGHGARSTARKLVEVEALAEFRGYRVASCGSWSTPPRTAGSSGPIRRSSGACFQGRQPSGRGP